MSNISNEQPHTIAEQIAHINTNLKQIRELIEEPKFTYATYQKIIDLTSEIRGTAVAIALNKEASAYYRQVAGRAISEASQIVGTATKKLRQYVATIQREQRARRKMQRPDKT